MPMKMSRIEYGPRLALALVAARNERDIDALAAALHDDVVLETAAGETIRGRAAVVDYWRGRFALRAGDPLDIEAVTGFGHDVILRWHTPARRGIDLYRFREERVSEWEIYVKEALYNQ